MPRPPRDERRPTTAPEQARRAAARKNRAARGTSHRAAAAPAPRIDGSETCAFHANGESKSRARDAASAWKDVRLQRRGEAVRVAVEEPAREIYPRQEVCSSTFAGSRAPTPRGRRLRRGRRKRRRRPVDGRGFTAMRTGAVAPTPNTSWPRTRPRRLRSVINASSAHVRGVRHGTEEPRVRARRRRMPPALAFPRRSLARTRAQCASSYSPGGFRRFQRVVRVQGARHVQDAPARLVAGARHDVHASDGVPARWRTRAGRPRDHRRRETWRSSRGRLLGALLRPMASGGERRAAARFLRQFGRCSVVGSGKTETPATRFIRDARQPRARSGVRDRSASRGSPRSPWDDAMTTSAKMARRTRPRRRSPRASTRRPPRPAARCPCPRGDQPRPREARAQALAHRRERPREAQARG